MSSIGHTHTLAANFPCQSDLQGHTHPSAVDVVVNSDLSNIAMCTAVEKNQLRGLRQTSN